MLKNPYLAETILVNTIHLIDKSIVKFRKKKAKIILPPVRIELTTSGLQDQRTTTVL